MSAQMMNVLGWAWWTCFAALALISVRSRRALPRVALVVICWVTFFVRELGARLALRALLGERVRAGLAADHFAAGGQGVLHYLDRSGPAVLFPAVALGFVTLLAFKDAPWLSSRRSVLHLSGLTMGGLCLAWWVAALVTRSVGVGTGASLIWGLAIIAWVALDRRSERAEKEARLMKAA